MKYITDADAAAKYQPRGNYLTSHQDISGKSDKSHTHSVKINGVTKTIAATGGTPVDLGNYLTSHQSLAGYATETWVKGLKYITDADAAAKYQPRGNYLTSHQDISGKSDKSHTHSVKINGVTKTIAATGGTPVDLGNYLTSHQSLAGYAKTSQLPTKTSQLTNDSGFLTKDDIKCKITIRLKSTISANDDKLKGVPIEITQDGKSIQSPKWGGDPITVAVNAGGEVRISVSPVPGYITPLAVEIAAIAGDVREITLTYTHLPIGIYIYDTDGQFTLPENWNSANNSKAVGVYVGTENSKFVIAPTLCRNMMSIWGESGKAISGVVLSNKESVAKQDYKGEANTEKIIAQLGIGNAPAAEFCRDYTFKNGKKGYLWSLGESQDAINNKSLINNAMNKIGGSAVKYDYWTSTLASSVDVWIQHFGSDWVSFDSRSTEKYLRAVCAP